MMKISIVIPTHRRHELLSRAVFSALRACGPADEVVVVCDHDPSAVDFLHQRFSDARLVVENNQGKRGASGARNFAISIASGDVIVFLDDDDEMVEGYPSEIRSVCMKTVASWGFSSYLIRTSSQENSTQATVICRPDGFPDRTTSFRRRIAGLGTGFWIKRDLFLEVGGLNEALALDEDTDLCCRLLALGLEPWFLSASGVIVDRSPNVDRLTVNSSPEIKATCSLHTFVQNIDSLRSFSGAEAYLALRAQKSIIRSGNLSLLSEVYSRVRVQTKLLLFFKRASYFIRRKV